MAGMLAGQPYPGHMAGHDETPETGGPIDAWASYLPGQELVPAYLTSRFAAQYRVIVEVLLAEQDTSLTGLSYDEVADVVTAHLLERVPSETVETLIHPDTFHLEARLDQLVRWRVLIRWQDPARTGEDFLRRRDRYQLTPLAAALHTFWSKAEDSEESAGDLTLAPRAIHDRLAAFGEAVHDVRFRVAAGEFQQISTLHQAMATAARGWQRGLAHAVSGAPDPGKQELLWRTLRAYIGMWGEQVDIHSPRISALIDELAPTLTDEVWRACVRTMLADASDDLIAAHAKRWAHTWEALRSWFGGADGQARRLRRQLRDLVAPWARNMHILMDTGGAVSRRAELLELASTIERAPDETSAWRIWDTAVGAFSSRHLLLASESADDHTLPWAAAPAAPVTARFREQGTRAAVGRRTRIANYSKGKAAARRARAQALAMRAEAEAGLRQRSGTSMESWGDVSDAELDLLLELVSAARRASAGAEADQPRSTVTGDGRWRVTLHPPARPTDTATLMSPNGNLSIANWTFEMEAQHQGGQP